MRFVPSTRRPAAPPPTAPAAVVRTSAYPLTGVMLLVGLAAGGLLGAITLSWQHGFVLASLFWVVGALWSRDDPPILAFCLGYQWCYFAPAFYFWSLSRVYPGQPRVGDVEAVALLSSIGLIVVALGLRFGQALAGRITAHRQRRMRAAQPIYNVSRLFWLVAALYAFEWFFDIGPMHTIISAGAQAASAVLAFRVVLLFMFFSIVIRQRRGYGYAAVLFLFTLMPSLASKMSGFKVYFFLLFVALMAEWRPWSRYRNERRKAWRQVPVAVLVGTLTIGLGTVWIGGVKGIWRNKLETTGLEMSRVEKIEAYLDTFGEVITEFSWAEAAPAVLGRLSGGAAHFSLTLQRVPAVIDHEHGLLTLRVVDHVTRPRIFFPNKPNLGGDSWLVQRYAGLRVAGDRERTSIGFSYMAQFYVDYGAPVMFIALLGLGMLLGTCYRFLALTAPSQAMFGGAVTVVFLEHFLGYEAELAKMLGGLLMKEVVFLLLMSAVGMRIHRHITRAGPSRRYAYPAARLPSAPAVAPTVPSRAVP